MKYLFVGGPADGEMKDIPDGMSKFRFTYAGMSLPSKTGEPDIWANDFDYVKFHLDYQTKVFVYEPDIERTFTRLLTCYAPRLAKMAEDEQRRVERQLPPSDLQAKR
jgi:hypothetical protein